MKSLELFTGAGGLAIGVSQSGFEHLAVVERDKYACDTIRENKRRGVEPLNHWPLHQGDVAEFDFKPYIDKVDLLAGGPPCQPFSLGGKHRGHLDQRNLFPEVVRAVRELRPRAVLIENVKGLLRRSFAEYFEYILLQLTYPEVIQTDRESWLDHLGRLERHRTRAQYQGLSYHVVFRLLNSADYGVPQRRERVMIVAFRSDVEANWSFPERSHSLEALLWDQWVTGDYWERGGVASADRPEMPQKYRHYLRNMRQRDPECHLRPWLTVRNALSDLPEPDDQSKATKVLNHFLVPGARPYQGHTGSPLDEPAKTIKAGDHGVPGGENMLALTDGRVRYLTIRESARLQTFPDDYVFHGSWTETMRQLGNAVPVTLAQAVATGISEHLIAADVRGACS